METNTYPLTWDLDVFFKGGAASPELEEVLKGVKADIARISQTMLASSGSEGVPGRGRNSWRSGRRPFNPFRSACMKPLPSSDA